MTETRMDRRSARQRERRTRKTGDHILRGMVEGVGGDPDDFVDLTTGKPRWASGGPQNEDEA